MNSKNKEDSFCRYQFMDFSNFFADPYYRTATRNIGKKCKVLTLVHRGSKVKTSEVLKM